MIKDELNLRRSRQQCLQHSRASKSSFLLYSFFYIFFLYIINMYIIEKNTNMWIIFFNKNSHCIFEILDSKCQSCLQSHATNEEVSIVL